MNTYTVYSNWNGKQEKDVFDTERRAQYFATRIRNQWGVEAVVVRSDLQPFCVGGAK